MGREMGFYRGFMKRSCQPRQVWLPFHRCCSETCFCTMALRLCSRFGTSMEPMVGLSPCSFNTMCFPRHLAVARFNAVSQASIEKCPALCVRSRSPRGVKQNTCNDAAVCACCTEGSYFCVPYRSTAINAGIKIDNKGTEEERSASKEVCKKAGRSAIS